MKKDYLEEALKELDEIESRRKCKIENICEEFNINND